MHRLNCYQEAVFTQTETTMSSTVLLLNASHEPLKVISWRRAIQLVLDDKAVVLKGYAHQFIRSITMVFERPAVVRLKEYVRIRTKVKLSNRNIMARDGFQCQYCGAAPRTKDGHPITTGFNIDHVIPRSHARDGKVRVRGKEVGVTSWANLVTSCKTCNTKKGPRTPEEAGLTLLREPKQPSMLEAVRISVMKVVLPGEWVEYLPA